MLDGCGFRDLCSKRDGETGDSGGGFRKALGVVGICFAELVRERARGAAGGDIRQRVRGVRGVEQIALQHDVRDRAGERNAVRLERAEHCFQVMNKLGERCIFQRGSQAGCVEVGLEGVCCGGGEAETAGRVLRRWRKAPHPARR